MSKKTANISRFTKIELSHGRRDSKIFKAEDIKTLAISKRGRVTIPSFIKSYYGYKGNYFIIRQFEKKELLITFTNKKTDEVKKVFYYKNETLYVEIGPQIKALGRIVKESTVLPFVNVEGENSLILDITSLPSL